MSEPQAAAPHAALESPRDGVPCHSVPAWEQAQGLAPRQSGDRHRLNFIKWAGVWGSLPVQDLSSSDCLTTIAIAPAYAGVRIPLLCCDTAQIASALSELALGTGCSIHYVIFMPHSEKRNYHSVKVSFLCLFSILDENKRVSLSFDLCHFLTDTFRMLTSI